MGRQSISFTEPNDLWLKEQVRLKEYSSKSELVNDLIRQARNAQVRLEALRNRLEMAEASGISDLSLEEIKEKAKAGMSK